MCGRERKNEKGGTRARARAREREHEKERARRQNERGVEREIAKERQRECVRAQCFATVNSIGSRTRTYERASMSKKARARVSARGSQLYFFTTNVKKLE